MELRLNGKYQKFFYMRINVVNTQNNTRSFCPFVGSTKGQNKPNCWPAPPSQIQ